MPCNNCSLSSTCILGSRSYYFCEWNGCCWGRHFHNCADSLGYLCLMYGGHLLCSWNQMRLFHRHWKYQHGKNNILQICYDWWGHMFVFTWKSNLSSNIFCLETLTGTTFGAMLTWGFYELFEDQVKLFTRDATLQVCCNQWTAPSMISAILFYNTDILLWFFRRWCLI